MKKKNGKEQTEDGKKVEEERRKEKKSNLATANKSSLPNCSLTCDTAAYPSMMPKLEELKNVHKVKEPGALLADGSRMPITHEGDLGVFQGEEMLKSSVSDSVSDPLLSVADLCQTIPVTGVFDDEGVRFVRGKIDISRDRLMGDGPLDGGMYSFNPAKPFTGLARKSGSGAAIISAPTTVDKPHNEIDALKDIDLAAFLEDLKEAMIPDEDDAFCDHHSSVDTSLEKKKLLGVIRRFEEVVVPYLGEKFQPNSLTNIRPDISRESDKGKEKEHAEEPMFGLIQRDKPRLDGEVAESSKGNNGKPNGENSLDVDETAPLIDQEGMRALLELLRSLEHNKNKKKKKRRQRMYDPSCEDHEKTFHDRFGHLSGIVETIQSGAIRGSLPDVSSWKKMDKPCIYCLAGKLKQRSYSGDEDPVDWEPGQHAHVDIQDMVDRSLGGHRYELTIEDHKSTKLLGGPLKERRDAGDLAIPVFNRMERMTGNKLKQVTIDGAPEFIQPGSVLGGWLKTNGVEIVLSTPYTSNENNVAENANKRRQEVARTIRIRANLPKSFHAEASRFSRIIKGRIVKKGEKITPDEVFSGHKPKWNNIHVFGCFGFSWIPEKKRGKNDVRCRPGIYLGPESKGHRMWDPLTRQIFQGSTVMFDENGFGIAELKKLCKEIGAEPIRDLPDMVETPGEEEEAAKGVTFDATEMNRFLETNVESLDGGTPPLRFSDGGELFLPDSGNSSSKPHENSSSHSDFENTGMVPSEPNSGGGMDQSEVSNKSPPRRSTRQRNAPIQLSHDRHSKKSHAKHCYMVHQCRKAQNDVLSRQTPRGSRQALHGPDKEKWKEPMVREYQTHVLNHTFDMVSPASITSKRGRVIGQDSVDEDGTKVYFVDGVWAYRIKTKDGAITKYKARWCVNGAGMDCDQEDTFSPVARMASVKTMFALAATMGLTVRSGDVPGAYLQAPIDDDTIVYCRQPDGFVKEGKEDHWLRLNQAVYGLPQAGRLWYKVIHEFLLSIGFKQNGADPCIYWLRRENQLMAISLSVDDILDLSTCDDLRKEIIDQLIERFQYLDEGECEWFLGMKVTQNYDEITLSQEAFIQTIIDEYPQAKKTNTPGVQGKTLGPNETGTRKVFPYRSLCGKLRYVTMTRPDIEYQLNQCCKYQENPSEEHVQALLRIVGYLRKFPKVILRYEKKYVSLMDLIIKLGGYCDSSHADEKVTFRSTYGFNVQLNGMDVVWKSRTTPAVATSTTEAEYVALAELLKELMHIMYLLEEMEFIVEKPMIILSDSNGAIGVAKFQRINNRTKHINVRYHFVREKAQDGTIDVRRVPTSENVADMFTKNLGKIILDRLLARTSLRMIV